MTDLKEALLDKPIQKPAKRWRNEWRAIGPRLPCPHCGACASPGERYFGCFVFPTKDVAETEALRALAEDMRLRGYYNDVHLGAFPIPEGE